MANIILNAVKDTFYGSTYSAGPNGTLTTLSFGGWGDWYYPFIEFNLSSIPAGSTITQASFKLYATGTPVNNPNIQIQKVTSSWGENTLTRTNLPTINTTNRGTLPKPTANIYVSVDITTLVQEWFANPSTNFGIKLNSTSNGQTNSSAQSRENTNPPQLDITYTTPTGGQNFNQSFLSIFRKI